MRGLLAIEPLYHQIVSGKKTQTRRSGGLDIINENPDDWTLFNGGVYLLSPELAFENFKQFCETGEHKFGSAISFLQFIGPNNGMLNPVEVKPRYKVGEVLYLKEPWTFLKSDTTDFWNGYAYKFGAREYCAISDRGAELGGTEIKFKNKLFMPAVAARAFIRVTGIKCERLLDISDEDCIAEGIEYYNLLGFSGWYNYSYRKEDQPISKFNYPKDSFISLYKFANKMKPTAEITNIFVWVYQFEYLPEYKLTLNK